MEYVMYKVTVVNNQTGKIRETTIPLFKEGMMRVMKGVMQANKDIVVQVEKEELLSNEDIDLLVDSLYEY